MITALAALVLLAADPPAPAAPATAPPVAPATVTAEPVYGIVEGKDAPKPKMVCFKDPVLGSKIPTRRCMPRDEFERRQAEERQYIDQVQRDARAPVSR